MSYDMVRYFEQVTISKENASLHIPDAYYAVYQNIIAINHFNNEAHIFAHCYEGENNIPQIESLLRSKNLAEYPFNREGAVRSNLDDQSYIDLVLKCKEHCQRGDVFQIVPSKRFSQDFSGDEFNVYRA
jgi:anthranilate synthase component 1